MKTFSATAALLAAGVTLAIATPANALQLKETYKDWAVYVHEKANNKTCFAISKPMDMEPKNVNRGSVFFYVSSWPDDKVKDEVSIKVGYPLAGDTAPAAIIGADQFNLFADGDKAFIADETMENKLVDAMKRGSTMVIKGRSQRGTETIDKYSLSGISAALDRVSKECK
jgi:invasion protein IalB